MSREDSVRRSLAIRSSVLKVIFVLVVTVVMCSRAFCWGCDGHQTVAALAFRHLDANLRTTVLDVLQHLPSNPQLQHYCMNSGLSLFVDVSTWADDIRVQRPDTGAWHFIDLPLGIDRPDLRFCSGSSGCIITAIQQQVAILRSGFSAPEVKALALLFLIHFVGDLHQPLHTTTNNDRGANCLPVTLFGTTPTEQPTGTWRPNLHGVWDTEQVQKAMSGRSVLQFAEYLDRKYPSDIQEEMSRPVNIFNWTWQSHRLAVAIAYGDLPQHVVLESPLPISKCTDNNNVGQRLASLHETVDARYFAHSSTVIETQLTKAGVRLAMILNTIWR